jgi:CheY-like chemotaxis protein
MDGRGRSVLVVDDDETIRELVSVLLTCEGYAVTTAVNGRDALKLLEQWRPDLIVLDMLMPVMDGGAFLGAQQASAQLRDIPVIVMSASFKLKDEHERSAASALLPKPFRIGDLLAHVEALMTRADLALA